jgi:hypothetical protein
LARKMNGEMVSCRPPQEEIAASSNRTTSRTAIAGSQYKQELRGISIGVE